MLRDTSQNDGLSYDAAIPSSKDLSVQQRQFRLNDASKKYIEGKIPEDALRKVEEALEVDYAQTALDQTSIWAEVSRLLMRWIKFVKAKTVSEAQTHSEKDVNTAEKR